MNNETRFLGYNQGDCDFVVMDVLKVGEGKVVIDPGNDSDGVEFSVWDLLKAIRRFKRCERITRRTRRKLTRRSKK